MAKRWRISEGGLAEIDQEVIDLIDSLMDDDDCLHLPDMVDAGMDHDEAADLLRFLASACEWDVIAVAKVAD
ncbi:MAG: hypothetical protein R2867_05340 [Caldilineaceae bacterium]